MKLIHNAGFYCLFLILLTGCVRKSIYRSQLQTHTQERNNYRDSLLRATNLIDSLDRQLLRAQGGNEMLLAAQRQLEDRLIALDRQSRDLRGNLSTTQQNLQRQIQQLTQEKEALTAAMDTLRSDYRRVITRFTDQLQIAADTLAQKTAFNERALVRLKSGSLSIIIQEEELFNNSTSLTLAPERDGLLQPIVDVLHAYPLFELQVIGHTDNQPLSRRLGSNLAFAGRRSALIAKELTDTYFVSASRIIASSRGGAAPLKSNASPEGQKANRRIEFRISNSLSNLLRELAAVE